jgi:hypothetical protein
MTDLMSAPDAGSPVLAPDADEVTARLEALDQVADEHEAHSLSGRTWELYAHDWAHFTGWCQTAGRIPLPAEVATVRRFLADLSRQVDEDGAWCYQPATLRRRLAGIAAAHRAAEVTSPTRSPAVARVITGIERERKHPPRRLRPLLIDDIRAMLASMDYPRWPEGITAARDAFVLLAGFAGALRRAELASLSTNDVARHPADGLHVRLASSKTDQTARGAVVALPHCRFRAHFGSVTCGDAWFRSCLAGGVPRVGWRSVALARSGSGRSRAFRVILAPSGFARCRLLCL